MSDGAEFDVPKALQDPELRAKLVNDPRFIEELTEILAVERLILEELHAAGAFRPVLLSEIGLPGRPNLWDLRQQLAMRLRGTTGDERWGAGAVGWGRTVRVARSRGSGAASPRNSWTRVSGGTTECRAR